MRDAYGSDTVGCAPHTIFLLIVNSLLVFAAGCSLEKRTSCESADKQIEDVSTAEAVAAEPVEKTFTANQFCAACHYGFGEEDLALAHEQAGIGCERCHGESERHRSDEDNVTPPEIMYTKARINPTCMMCHPRHEIRHVPAHGILLDGAKTVFDSGSGEQQMYCTTCHAKDHRINVRTIRWDKATGKLLKE